MLLTGCGIKEEKEKKLVCSAIEKDDALNINKVSSMTYKNDKLKHNDNGS